MDWYNRPDTGFLYTQITFFHYYNDPGTPHRTENGGKGDGKCLEISTHIFRERSFAYLFRFRVPAEVVIVRSGPGKCMT